MQSLKVILRVLLGDYGPGLARRFKWLGPSLRTVSGIASRLRAGWSRTPKLARIALAVAVVFASLSIGQGAAEAFGRRKYCKRHPTAAFCRAPSNRVPELDAKGGEAALFLTLGGLAVIQGRRRRPRATN